MQVLTVFCMVSFLASLTLFCVEVFVKGREKPGQVVGLTFAALGLVLFLGTYSDGLPGNPSVLRHILRILPGGPSSLAFLSSSAALVALSVVFVLRAFIYVRYFVYPALTLSDEEYLSPERVEERANDFTAPILSYGGFAIVASAALVGIYGLPEGAGLGIFVGLELVYFLSRIFYDLIKYLRRLWVEIRVAFRTMWNLVNDVVIVIIVVLGQLERWRTRRPAGDEEAFRALLQARLGASRAKTQARNERDRARLRDLIKNDEEEGGSFATS
jgi:hypothetical protein